MNKNVVNVEEEKEINTMKELEILLEEIIDEYSDKDIRRQIITYIKFCQENYDMEVGQFLWFLQRHLKKPQ